MPDHAITWTIPRHRAGPPGLGLQFGYITALIQAVSKEGAGIS